MKKTKARGFRYLVAVSLIFLLVGLAPYAHAGFDPTPFRDAGKLGAVANNLESIDDRINTLLSVPPDPLMPWDIGEVNQLSAMERELDVLYGRVSAVLDVPPEDPMVIEALTDVRDCSQAIVDTVDEAISQDDMSLELLEALIGVHDGAQSIVDLANENLDLIHGS